MAPKDCPSFEVCAGRGPLAMAGAEGFIHEASLLIADVIPAGDLR